MEFDIPVALMHLREAKLSQSDKEVDKRLTALISSSILLACSIRWVTAHQTSDHHRENYLMYMTLYLHSILALQPSLKLHPNHHNALHIGDYLLGFGPMHGWWMYPFERLIGRLQQTPTNDKIGENDCKEPN